MEGIEKLSLSEFERRNWEFWFRVYTDEQGIKDYVHWGKTARANMCCNNMHLYNSLLSRQVRLEDFIRPKEPQGVIYLGNAKSLPHQFGLGEVKEDGRGFIEAHKDWDNWKSLFVGDFEYIENKSPYIHLNKCIIWKNNWLHYPTVLELADMVDILFNPLHPSLPANYSDIVNIKV